MAHVLEELCLGYVLHLVPENSIVLSPDLGVHKRSKRTWTGFAWKSKRLGGVPFLTPPHISKIPHHIINGFSQNSTGVHPSN